MAVKAKNPRVIRVHVHATETALAYHRRGFTLLSPLVFWERNAYVAQSEA